MYAIDRMLPELTSFHLPAGASAGAYCKYAPQGKVFARHVVGGGINCFYYLPRRLDPARPTLVCVHGISRNALEHVFAFRRKADELGFAVAAPVFDNRDFRGYQTLGCNSDWRAMRAFLAVLEDAVVVTGFALPPNIFGFSGGAQFAHRFALTHPARVNALAVASAGWYTFLTEAARYPLGLSGSFAPSTDLSAFLELPILVMVGDADLDRDANLRKGRKVDALEGRHRVERAKRWASAVNDAALRRGLTPPAVFANLPGAAHSFADCANAGMVSCAADFLFKQQSPRTGGASTGE